jgi:hypothetical protein
MTTKAHQTLADMLPVQKHYCLLSNGEKYARFGHGKKNGLLVFETNEKANEFCETVGVGLPEFKPVIVDAESLLTLIEEIGAVCVTDGLNVGVAVLSD